MITFYFDTFVVETTSVNSPIYRVADWDYDPESYIIVRKDACKEVIDASKVDYDPEMIAILIATIKIQRAKGAESRHYKFLSEEVITNGLVKLLLNPTISYDSWQLKGILLELTPKQVEEILTSLTPHIELQKYLN